MIQKTFAVTLSSGDGYEPVSREDLRGYLWSGMDTARRFDVSVVSVKESNADDFVVTGKIQAIKRIRALLQCSLKDAKFLTDHAENHGSAEFFSVEVHAGPSGFRVIDNR